MILHPLFFAFSRRPGASSAPLESNRDFPISIPKHVLRKVYAMPDVGCVVDRFVLSSGKVAKNMRWSDIYPK